MSQALQLVDEREPYNRQQLDLLKHTIAAGLDDNEFGLLVEVAKRTGLDLFQRQLYGIKRGGKMTLQTGIDGYRLLAARTGQLAGIDDALYDDETAKHPSRASVTVWRLVQGQRVPFTATARWSEYYQSAGGMWDKMPFLMLGKCAEALALRKAFPAELSGVYTREEMAQADNEAVVDAETGEITRAPRQQTARPAVANGKLNWGALRLKATQHGIRTQAEWEAFARKHLSIPDDSDFDTRAFTADHYAILDRALDGDASLEGLPVGGKN